MTENNFAALIDELSDAVANAHHDPLNIEKIFIDHLYDVPESRINDAIIAADLSTPAIAFVDGVVSNLLRFIEANLDAAADCLKQNKPQYTVKILNYIIPLLHHHSSTPMQKIAESIANEQKRRAHAENFEIISDSYEDENVYEFLEEVVEKVHDLYIISHRKAWKIVDDSSVAMAIKAGEKPDEIVHASIAELAVRCVKVPRNQGKSGRRCSPTSSIYAVIAPSFSSFWGWDRTKICSILALLGEHVYSLLTVFARFFDWNWFEPAKNFFKFE